MNIKQYVVTKCGRISLAVNEYNGHVAQGDELRLLLRDGPWIVKDHPDEIKRLSEELTASLVEQDITERD